MTYKDLVIFSDGGSRGNPGPGAAGFLITDTKKNKILGKGIFLGKCTNNHAEYMGLITALEHALKLNPQSVKMFCDSELLVRQVQGKYKVKSPNLKPLYQKLTSLLENFQTWQIDHVYREDNKYADMMANRAMDDKSDIEEKFQTTAKKPKPAKIAVLISGGGRTMLNILDSIKSGYLNAEISVVISSRSKIAGVERTKNANLPLEIIRKKDHPDITDFSNAIVEVLDKHKVDLIVLGGWLCLWHIPEKYNNRVINTHPALLPAFGGQGMFGHHVHKAVIERGCKISGCTVHFCNNEYDDGPIIIQRTCPVYHDDDADTLADRVFEQECIAVPDAIKLFIEDKIKVDGKIVKVIS